MKRLRLALCTLGFAAVGVLGALVPTAAQAHPDHGWDDLVYWGAYSTFDDCYDTGQTLTHQKNWHVYTCAPDHNDGRLVYELWYVPQQH